MCRIDHQLVSLAILGCEACKYLAESAHPAPSDEPIVNRLVRAIFSWCIAPAQPVADHKNNPADNPPIIDPGTPCDSGKYGSILRICASLNQIRSLMAMPPSHHH
jgi:hypothetical protein